MIWSICSGWKYREESWLPSLCHMIDTGHVAREILRGLPSPLTEKMDREFSMPLDKVIKVLAFWAALHDIGKVSPGLRGW